MRNMDHFIFFIAYFMMVEKARIDSNKHQSKNNLVMG